MAPKRISAATNRNPLQQNESLTWNLMLGSERNPSFSSIQYYEQTYDQILQDEIFTVKIFPHQFKNFFYMALGYKANHLIMLLIS